MTYVILPTNESEIWLFLTTVILFENLRKNVLLVAHKKFEHIQHTEIYLLILKIYKHEKELPFDMVGLHVFFHLHWVLF